MSRVTRSVQDTEKSEVLYVSIELSKKSWKLGLSDGGSRRPRVVSVPAREWDKFSAALAKAKVRFGLREEATVHSCYEAGRDGFWIHRALMSRGVENIVVDMEFFAWRRFNNRREVAAAAGLTPTPYQSGDSPREQGISKAGNARVRTMMVEIAWSWLRYQPQSKLAQWFWKRFGKGTTRQRRVGIVALARRLLIDLWRLLEQGVVPDGARLKTA